MKHNTYKWLGLSVAIALMLSLLAACQPPQEIGVREVTERGKLLCAGVSGNCVEGWNGTDIKLYSDEGSSATFQVAGSTGDVILGGTTPLLTIGDAGAEDAGIVFDGNAQDFYLALDDSADDLVIGLGSSIGVTPTLSIDENRNILIGADGVGKDVTFYSDTAGDYMLWDTSEEALTIVGTANQDALNVDDGNVDIDDDLDVNGTSNLDNVDIDLTSEMNIDGELVCIGATGDGGTADGDDDLIVKGDCEVDDTLDVDGDIDLDGDGFDVDITGGIDMDADQASGFSTSAQDITIEAETGSVIIKGDEAVADAVYLDANDNASTGVTIASGSTAGVVASGGPWSIRNSASGSVTLDFRDYADTTDDDMAHGVLTTNCTDTGSGSEDCDFSIGVVEGGAAADTRFHIDADDGVDIGSAANANVTLISGANTLVHNGDVTLSAEASGGNLGAKNEFIGLPRIKLIGVGAGSNPASQTISLVDDTPAGEYAVISTTVTLSNDTGIVKYGTNSLKAAWTADAVAGHGFKDAGLGAAAAWDDMESAGLLVYSDVTWAAGDLTLVLTDDGGDRTYNIPALTVTNKWVWLEVDISAGDLSAISDVAILMSAQGEAALGAFNMYLDIMYVWDSADEEALGVDIQQDGVLSVVDQADGTNLAELTNYIVHYETGVDFIVWITDESAAYNLVLVAY